MILAISFLDEASSLAACRSRSMAAAPPCGLVWAVLIVTSRGRFLVLSPRTYEPASHVILILLISDYFIGFNGATTSSSWLLSDASDSQNPSVYLSLFTRRRTCQNAISIQFLQVVLQESNFMGLVTVTTTLYKRNLVSICMG